MSNKEAIQTHVSGESNSNSSQMLFPGNSVLFKCNWCSIACLTRQGLKLHMASMHGDISMSASLSEQPQFRTFTDSQNTFTNKHLMQDSVIRSWRSWRPKGCVHCYSTFATKSDLRKHIRESHMWLECSSCQKVFKSPGLLTEHKRQEHPNSVTIKVAVDGKVMGPQEHICMCCQTRFFHGVLLENHLLTKCTTGFTEVNCLKCATKFKCHCLFLQHARLGCGGNTGTGKDHLRCVTRKQTLRSLSSSYQKKDGRAWPRHPSFGMTTTKTLRSVFS